jgi:hypothetical protein
MLFLGAVAKHSLEQLLFLLSDRIRRETKNDELADATKLFASASHDYEPVRQPEPLAEMCQDWTRRFSA